MPNPLVAQGTLNRVQASIVWNNFPGLNVTPPYLGKDGIRLTLEGLANTMINTMTGMVTSPEPYMAASMNFTLLKSQPIAQLYKNQMENTPLLGDCTVRPDSAVLGIYNILNCAIESIRELNFAGEDAAFAVTCRGTYIISNALWG
jgi:hypothetical protein